MRPPFKTHGGKFYLAPWIIQHFPKHSTYAELFGGGYSVGLRKPRVSRETYVDLDCGKVAVMRAIRDTPLKFQTRLKRLSYTEETFEDACRPQPCSNELSLDAAVRHYIRSRMSRGGLGTAFAWSTRLRGGKPGDVNAWETAIEEIPQISKRLQGVNIFQGEAFVFFDLFKDDSDTLLYLDPPYLPSTRVSPGAYGHLELGNSDHEALLGMCRRAQCKIALSGYLNDLYEAMLSSWRVACKEVASHASQSFEKPHKIECLWMNY